jgi:hypothetical protein
LHGSPSPFEVSKEKRLRAKFIVGFGYIEEGRPGLAVAVAECLTQGSSQIRSNAIEQALSFLQALIPQKVYSAPIFIYMRKHYLAT